MFHPADRPPITNPLAIGPNGVRLRHIKNAVLPTSQIAKLPHLAVYNEVHAALAVFAPDEVAALPRILPIGVPKLPVARFVVPRAR